MWDHKQNRQCMQTVMGAPVDKLSRAFDLRVIARNIFARAAGRGAVPSDITHIPKLSVASTQQAGSPVRVLDVAGGRCAQDDTWV